MSTVSRSADIAELILISDSPIDEGLMRVVRQLWGEGTTDADVVFDFNRRWCKWPCRVPCEGDQSRRLTFHIYSCVGFLVQRRQIIDRIHQLGCNLELCVNLSRPLEEFSLAASAMKQLSDLRIQLSFHPH